jgi:hypothetical protein
MEWFAVSSKFYIDLDNEGVSERAQMLALRAMAWCADNETSGEIPGPSLHKLGLTTVARRTEELLASGMLKECEQNEIKTRTFLKQNASKRDQSVTYFFPRWDKWQAPMEAQLRKRNRDREAAAERRQKPEKVVRQSHTSRVKSERHSNSNKNKDISTYVENTPHVSNAPDDERRGPAVPIDAWTIIRNVVPREHSQATKTALALEASAMLVAGTPEDDVRATLELWLTKPNLGPRTLPHLLSDVIRSRAPTPGVGAATTKAQGWLNIANQANQLMNEQRAIE